MPAVSGKRIFSYSAGKDSFNRDIELFVTVSAIFELDPGINVLGVLSEDDHINDIQDA